MSHGDRAHEHFDHTMKHSRSSDLTDHCCPLMSAENEADLKKCPERVYLPVVGEDPSLVRHADDIWRRFNSYHERKVAIEEEFGSLENFALGHNYFGFTRHPQGILFREWLPGAVAVHLFGDFNHWDRKSHPLVQDETNVYSILIPYLSDGKSPIPHGSKVKLCIRTLGGDYVDRLPAYIRKTTQEPGRPYLDGVFWDPDTPFHWKYSKPPKPSSLRIYEAHIGMSSQSPKIASYRYFEEHMLPRIKALHYNVVQLMGIMEHSYYASFGYQVTNFFAISSRFGTPENLKSLIDKAHSLGICVLLDIVHSHASPNTIDGLNMIDGSDSAYFHSGSRGLHKLWKSKLFDYGKDKVVRFLLSNIRFYLEEYRFDGFRFDGVTSMIYRNHGIDTNFTGEHWQYAESKLDNEALVYLMLANELVHSLDPGAITIAEDVSGFPTICRPVHLGGVGFDYRLMMSLPDLWKHAVKSNVEFYCSVNQIWTALTNRRKNEKTINYVECHDQSLVGDKTLAQQLFGPSIYNDMDMSLSMNHRALQCLALHKLIRLITHTCCGEGYLNFMGNEFGHPEWVDFPRDGNNYSYEYSRRRWDLCDSAQYRFRYLLEFDRALQKLEFMTQYYGDKKETIPLVLDEVRHLICFQRGKLVVCCNFHPIQHAEDVCLALETKFGKLEVILSSDETEFGGLGLPSNRTVKPFTRAGLSTPPYLAKVYVPSLSGVVFQLSEN